MTFLKTQQQAAAQFRFSMWVLLALQAQPAPSLWETRPSAVDHCEVWEITLLLPTPPVLLQVCSSWLQGCLAFSVACMEDKSGRIVLDHIFRYDVDRC